MNRKSSVFGFLVLAVIMVVTGLVNPAYATMVRNAYPQHDNYWTGRVMNSTAGFSKHNADIMYGKDAPDGKWQGWAKIDLSDIPENATITGASFFYYVVSQSDPAPATSVTAVNGDPVLADPEVLWQDIVDGAVISPDLVTDKGWVERPLNADGIAALQAALGQRWFALGLRKLDDQETRGHAKGYQAERFRPYLQISFGGADMGVLSISAPQGDIDTGASVSPEVTVRNNGDLEVPFRVWLVISVGADELYRQYIDVAGVPPGLGLIVSFPVWVAGQVAVQHSVTTTIDLANDANPLDNYAVSWFNVVQRDGGGGGNGGGGGGGGGEPPVLHWGWQEAERMPVGPSARQVKSGAWLAVDELSGMMYAAKGNSTREFYSFNPVSGRWLQLASIPGMKSPGKGAQAAADGNGSIYMVKGNNTSEFWRYDIASNTWEQLPDVPFGQNGLRVKGGTDLLHISQYGLDYIYMLKGPKTEFMRYNVQARAWTALENAPAGGRPKWGDGSWLAYDGDGHIYAHKSLLNEMWLYDLANDAWSGQVRGMPFFGSSFKPRKSKEGGSGVFKEGAVYALKGGNTPEFWTYEPAANDWAEKEPMPVVGTSLRSVKTGAGAHLEDYPYGRVMYSLKGRKTLEFWRYIMPPAEVQGHPGRTDVGIAGARNDLKRTVVRIEPNPVTGANAQLRYSVPAAGPARIALFDMAGRMASSQAVNLALGGLARVNVEDVASGVYLLRIDGNGYSATSRVLISR